MQIDIKVSHTHLEPAKAERSVPFLTNKRPFSKVGVSCNHAEPSLILSNSKFDLSKTFDSGL